MNQTLAIIDGIEQRLAVVVGTAAIAFSAADPHALPPKWAAVIVAVQAVAAKLSPRAAVVAAPAAPVADVTPAAAWAGAAEQDPALAAVDHA